MSERGGIAGDNIVSQWTWDGGHYPKGVAVTMRRLRKHGSWGL